jgi:transposase-like protein
MSNKTTRRTWTADQKREIVAEVRRRRSQKESFRAICAALNINEGSLRLWMEQFPERSLQPVTVIDRDLFLRGITLVTPEGFRIEGLAVETAAQLLERVR